MPAPSKKKQPVRHTAPPPAISVGLKMAGALCLGIALLAAFVLALEHFALVSPPGCGPQSGCDRATRSAWGTIPGIDWPTSLAGVAYFGGMLVAWLASSRGVNGTLRAIAWLGLIGSAVFVVVMLQHGFICKYCLATHITNVLFVGVMEIAASKTRSSERKVSRAPVRAGILTFIILSVALGIVQSQTKAKRLARDEADRQQAADEIVAKSQRDAMQPATQSTSDATTSSSSTQTPAAANATPFTGRWRLGPENAPIRIVMLMDYQCHDCQIMESQAMALLQRRTDVSLSVKHFPMCADCNPHVGGSRMHPNACWAARAAETAGMLKGNDGFWQMHQWLVQRRGSFTDHDFPPALQQMGFNAQQFLSMMQSNDTLRLVLGDIDEGAALGLHFTPMIFINGVELRGFIGNPGALTRTVDELAAKNLPPGSPTQDQPVKAMEKYIEDWRVQPALPIPPDQTPHSRGSASARTRLVVWGDLQDRFTAELDRAIQTEIAAGREITYEYRHYPADQSCNSNPNIQRTIYPMGCIAARAAESAAVIAGEEGYWKMHNWLMANQGALNDDALKRAAAETGLDAAAFLTAINSPNVAAAVTQDITSGAALVVNGIVPTLYINGKRVPRWKLGNTSILPQLLEAATR